MKKKFKGGVVMKKMLYKLTVLTVLLSAQNLFAQFSGGTGISTDPYIINNATDLKNINNYTYLVTPFYFKLTSDIDLNVVPYNQGTGWVGIGTDFAFVGNFNGNGHKITGMMIDTGIDNEGLFSHINGATISNLGVENVNITTTGINGNVGGLVGAADSFIVISNCYTTGSVMGLNHVGGLIGDFEDIRDTIKNCYSRASVTATTGPYWGGLIGVVYNGTVSNCYSVGIVSAGGNGFVGKGIAKITNCFWDMDASGQSTDGDYYGNTIGEHTAAMKTQSTFTGAGWNFTPTTGIWEMIGTNYPRLQIVPDAELPVELTSFTSTLDKNSVTLNWSTATEVNNFGFNIERRSVNSQEATANNWQKIGFVAGSGTSNSTHKYSYSDASVVSGTYAYRLKQIDNDGTFKYSQSVQLEVQLAPAAIGLNQNYPNPFNPTTMISFAVARYRACKISCI